MKGCGKPNGIKLPFVDCVYSPFMVILGIVYTRVYHIMWEIDRIYMLFAKRTIYMHSVVVAQQNPAVDTTCVM